MLEQIYVSKKLAVEEVKALLESFFHEIEFRLATLDDLDNYLKVKEGEVLGRDVVFFSLDENESEFPFHIELIGFPEYATDEREAWLGSQISTELQCRTLVPFTHPEKPTNPFFDLIFEEGKCWLADDCETLLGDGEGGNVKIVEAWEPPNWEFDAKGVWTGPPLANG